MVEAKGDNPNHLFNKPQVKDPIINEGADVDNSSTRKVYEYDLLTKRGKKYLITRM